MTNETSTQAILTHVRMLVLQGCRIRMALCETDAELSFPDHRDWTAAVTRIVDVAGLRDASRIGAWEVEKSIPELVLVMDQTLEVEHV